MASDKWNPLLANRTDLPIVAENLAMASENKTKTENVSLKKASVMQSQLNANSNLQYLKQIP